MIIIAIIFGSIAVLLLSFLLYGRHVHIKKLKEKVSYDLSMAPTEAIQKLYNTELPDWQKKLFKHELKRRGIKV